MRFVFAHRHRLPEARGRSIQAVQTAAALARAGSEVRLLAGGLDSGTPSGVMAFYGIDPVRSAGGLTLERLDGWGGLLFGWRAGKALRRGQDAGSPAFLVLNELTPEASLLAAKAKESGMGVLVDIQSLSPLLLQRGRPAVPPPAPPGGMTFSLLSGEGKQALALAGEQAAPAPEAHDEHEEHHDDHDHDRKAQEPELPPNLDQSPAPPPPPSSSTPEGEALLRTLERQADRETAILTAADGWIFRHKATMSAAARALPSARPSVVLGWGAQPNSAAGAVPKDLDILYCGGVGPDSGVETAIAAMQTLIPHKLAVAGPMTRPERERLRQAALSVGALERLTLLDAATPAEFGKLCARAKLGVLPLPGLTAEGGDPAAPAILFEMMAAGLPVVASRLKAIHEYAADGKEALFVTPDDPRPLAEGLRRLLTDVALREALGAAAKARAAGRTWDARAAGLLEFASSLKRT